VKIFVLGQEALFVNKVVFIKQLCKKKIDLDLRFIGVIIVKIS